MHYCHDPPRVGGYSTAQKAQEELTHTGNCICRLKGSFQLLVQLPSKAYQQIILVSFHRKYKGREGGKDIKKDRGREGERTEGGKEGGRRTKGGKMFLPLFMCRIKYKSTFLYCMIPISFNKNTVKKIIKVKRPL